MEAIHRNGSPNRKTQLWRKRQVSRCCPAGAFSPLAAFVSPCFRTVFRRWYAVPLGYPCRRIMPDLVTVESPEKTRKINRILGSGYVVRTIHRISRVSERAWTGVKLAFEFLVLTAARSAEVRLATWKEIDLESLVWAIPASRMKTAREHRVPLCSRAVEVLQQARRLRADSTAAAPGGIVFPSRRGKVLRDQSLFRVDADAGHRGRAPRLPVQLPGLGLGVYGPPAGGDRGRAGARGAQPDRGGLRRGRTCSSGGAG